MITRGLTLPGFPSFFEEKRQFFQERRTNFEFNFNNYNRLFHTREIGLYNGQPVPVYGGARLVGRISIRIFSACAGRC
ncbi:MAG TPA: hypothetical protein DEQ09_07925 [Bacteroidales bacterium]|nr:hypothetical protein [Bacteroidales bacterium]